MLTDVATAMREQPALKLFLESPRVSAAKKSEVIGKALTDRMPRLMLRFIQTMIMHRRQMLIPAVAEEYLNLVDEAEGVTGHQRSLAAGHRSARDMQPVAPRAIERVLHRLTRLQLHRIHACLLADRDTAIAAVR